MSKQAVTNTNNKYTFCFKSVDCCVCKLQFNIQRWTVWLVEVKFGNVCKS